MRYGTALESAHMIAKSQNSFQVAAAEHLFVFGNARLPVEDIFRSRMYSAEVWWGCPWDMKKIAMISFLSVSTVNESTKFFRPM